MKDDSAGIPRFIASEALPKGHELAHDIWRGTDDLARRLNCTERHARYLLEAGRVPGATKDGRLWIGRISRLTEMVDA
jgi:hypothetical protein